MYFVYILQSKRDPSHYYVGRCRDLDARLAKHNAGQSGHTAKYRPWHIIWYAAFTDKGAAFRCEDYLKTGSGRRFQKRHLGLALKTTTTGK